MRCNNCGWENPDTNTRCEKCNAPLSGGAVNPVQMSAPAPNLNKTVNEAVVFPEANVHNAANVCPQCGYPMREGVQICPNCGNGKTVDEPKSYQAEMHQQQKPGQGTVNPWVHVNAQVKCTLTPVPHSDEEEKPQNLQFKGESHELSRENLDTENKTITSKVQAVLSFENGQWFIEDKSQQQTTFIHVREKVSLKNGDVILMGNRQFIFNAE